MQRIATALLAALLAMGAARAADKTVPPPETVDKLAWLAGCWNVDGAEPGSGEQWSTAAGGTLLGTSRTVKGGKTTAFEFVQIRLTEPGQLAYIVQPSGQPPVTFNLLRQDKPNEFIFANLDNDFPSRIIYRHDSERILHASIVGTLKGKFTTIDFPMTRGRCEAAPVARSK
ncbi:MULTISPECIES: DUF6265 family protein [unclassified Janthinobacterium]|uniref:DUF6265 family protein n=1 Tax=unclassified Janthinobacterium TaxID=2610881 RepID=UPI00088D1615|nr:MULTISPECIES: DUF6265 family protein [unclassified Janthinobacterium]SDA38899.1 hypothetical protein SAMN03159349_00147 [Janthinobacterium sp. 551a]SFA79263.1 hypothetical protein SAMN03159300_101147 [Janthinobacterium sp. 344]